MISKALPLLASLALALPSLHEDILTARAVTIPQGAKWQIEIHSWLDFPESGTIEPADAKVWTLDFWYAIGEDEAGKTVIQNLKVPRHTECPFPFPLFLGPPEMR